MDKLERQSKIQMGLENIGNWKPNLKAISEQINLPISTVHDNYKRLLQQHRIKLWVEIISEAEAHTRFLEQQLKDRINQKKLKEHGYCLCGNILDIPELNVCSECR